MYLNIGSICAKFNELEAIYLEEDLDFICVTETHLTDDIGDEEIGLENYNLLRCDSESRHTGGVCFYIKNNWKAKIIESVSMGKMIWWLHIKIQNKNKMYNVIGVYRSPHKQNSPESIFIEFFENQMESLKSNENQLILGDFNIDWFNNNISKVKLSEIINDSCFKQVITEPTRITATTSTLIDYAVSNIEYITVRTNPGMKISDHESFEINIPIKEETDVVKRKSIKYLKYNSSIFRNNLLCRVLNEISSNSSTNEISNLLITSINFSLSPMIKNITLNNCKNNKWFNLNLKEMKRNKTALYQSAKWFNSDWHWNNYKLYRNEYVSEITLAKKTFVNNKIDNCEDQKSMWKAIKEVVLKKDSNKINEIIINGIKISEESKICNELNSFFVTSVQHIVNTIPYVQYENLIEENPRLQFKFTFIDIITLKTIMKSMNSKKDHHYVTVNMLLENFDILGTHLHHLITSSLHTGIFPEDLKESCIVPIQKIKNTKDPSEIRPVNMLMTLSKVLEKVVHHQLNKYFEENNLLSEKQSGFRQQHSCESLLNLVVTQWKAEVANKNCIVAVFLDLKRAFETINRDILLDKLQRYGVKNKELLWFKSYLENRTQRTRCGDHLSTVLNVNIGVPQGAILGTLLFIIYINDLGKLLKHSKVCMFADDTLIYITGKDPDECVRNLNQELKEVEKYLKMNKLKLNTNKTKAMILKGNTDQHIWLEGVQIEIVNEIKYLGIVIDKDLKFDPHYNYICKKISKKIAFLRRIRSKISTITAIRIYNTIVKPHFEYCSTLLFLGSRQMKERLQKLQNKGMRCILRCQRLTPIHYMLNNLQWLSVNQRLTMNVLMFVFKMRIGLLPKYLQDQLVYVSDVQPYNLRNSGDFRLKFSSTNFHQNVLLYNGLKLFNQMPNEIKSENNFFNFKRKIITYVKLMY